MNSSVRREVITHRCPTGHNPCTLCGSARADRRLPLHTPYTDCGAAHAHIVSVALAVPLPSHQPCLQPSSLPPALTPAHGRWPRLTAPVARCMHCALRPDCSRRTSCPPLAPARPGATCCSCHTTPSCCWMPAAHRRAAQAWLFYWQSPMQVSR